MVFAISYKGKTLYESKAHKEITKDSKANDDKNVIDTTAAQAISSEPSLSMSPVSADPQQIMTTKPPADTTTITKQTPSTWSKALDLYCENHGTLRATMLQVLGEVCNENEDTPWELPRRGAVLVEPSEVAAHFLQKDIVEEPAAVAASGGGVTGAVASAAWAAASFPVFLGKKVVKTILAESDDEDEEWVQEGDDAFAADDSDDEEEAADKMSTETSTRYGTKTFIVNVPQTRAAVQILEEEVNSYRLESVQGEMPLILGYSEWSQWTTSVLSKGSTPTVSNLSMHDKAFLLEVLACMGIAKIILRQATTQAADVIALFPASLIPKDGKEFDPNKLQAAIALWDIQNAERLLNDYFETKTNQLEACEKQALEYKRQGQQKLAVGQMYRRKLLRDNINGLQNKLLNLEKQKVVIEETQSTMVVMEAMKGSTALLRNFRMDASIENVDDVHDNFMAEMDELREASESIAITNDLAMGGRVTDEELLEELDRITVEDEEDDETNELQDANPAPAVVAGVKEIQKAPIQKMTENTVKQMEAVKKPAAAS